jgi:hypothetical protein
MKEEKKYIALFVQKMEKVSEPIFLTFSPAVKITGKPIFTPNGKENFSLVQGKTKRGVQRKVNRLRKENKLLWGINCSKVLDDAEIIILPI